MLIQGCFNTNGVKSEHSSETYCENSQREKTKGNYFAYIHSKIAEYEEYSSTRKKMGQFSPVH